MTRAHAFILSTLLLAACGGAPATGASAPTTSAAKSAAPAQQSAAAKSAAPAQQSAAAKSAAPASSAPAAVPSGPDSGCNLASTAEVSAAFGASAADAHPAEGSGETKDGITIFYCDYTDAGGAVLVALTYSRYGANAPMTPELIASAYGGTAVDGLGDKAGFADGVGLYVVKGRTLLVMGGVNTAEAQLPKLEQLARVIVPRM